LCLYFFPSLFLSLSFFLSPHLFKQLAGLGDVKS
jgi:hypothetical protein